MEGAKFMAQLTDLLQRLDELYPNDQRALTLTLPEKAVSKTAASTTSLRCTRNNFYEGDWNKPGARGCGTYTFRHNVRFDGDFCDGQFAKGVYTYPQGEKVASVLYSDEKMQFKYSDGLTFEEENWPYCIDDDRRFMASLNEGLNASPNERLTCDPEPRRIPSGCYDTCDGFYDPKKKCVVSAVDGSILRIPTATEEKWILEHCRKAWDGPVGYRPDLYEKWTSGRRCDNEKYTELETISSFSDYL